MLENETVKDTLEAKKQLLTVLEAQGIQGLKVAIHGSGDESCIEDIEVGTFDADGNFIANYEAADKKDAHRHIADDLPFFSVLEDFIYDQLNEQAGGWELDDGSDTCATINVVQQTVRFDMTSYYTKSIDESWSV